MATIEDRNQSIADYVEAHTGRTTLIAESGFKQPETPYCTVKLIDINYYQHDIAEDLDGFTEKVRGLAKLVYSVQAIGGDDSAGTGANKVLHRLVASFSASLPRQSLAADEIAVQEIGKVTDVSMTVASRIEDRALVNLGFSASVAEEFAFDSAIETGIEIDAGIEPDQQLTVPTDQPDCPAGG